MLKAAVQAKAGQMHLLAVTVLTSMQQQDLLQLGITRSLQQLVVERAMAAQKAGMDGVIASGQEAASIRQATGENFLIVCPGIRADDAATDDQKRSVGVSQAIANGADAIVVGRPIRLSSSPCVTAERIQREILHALNGCA